MDTKTTDEEVSRKMQDLGEMALVELRRRGVSEGEIQKRLSRKGRKRSKPHD